MSKETIRSTPKTSLIEQSECASNVVRRTGYSVLRSVAEREQHSFAGPTNYFYSDTVIPRRDRLHLMGFA